MANNSQQVNVGPIYAELTSQIIEDLDEHIIKSVGGAEPDYYTKALLGLWYIIKQNVYFIAREVRIVYSFYPVAGAVRLIMECVADAKHLQLHPEEAEEYFNTQQKVQEEMKRLGDKRFNLFKTGEINKYGELSKKTLARLKEAHGSDGLGAYSFLCCFTHPNIAGAMWFAADTKKGLKNLFIIDVLNKTLATWLRILEENSKLGVNAEEWSVKLAEAHNQTLGQIKTKVEK